MSLVLARVDQRLIHGQVLVGWVPVVQAEVLLVADDTLVADTWSADMMMEAAAPVLEARVLSLAHAADPALYTESRRIVLLTRTVDAMVALVRGGAPVTAINLGGIHYREGARRLLDYIFLTPEDIGALKTLKGLGVRLIARDLPSSEGVDVGALLGEGRVEYDALPAV